MEEKYLLKTLATSTRFLMALSFAVEIFGISDELGLILNINT